MAATEAVVPTEGEEREERTTRRRRAAWRPFAAAAAGAAVLVGTGFGVWATLNATATGSDEAISSGTLKLTMAANGVGFSSAITNMAPGDVVNRYVNLTNGGTLDAQNLTVQVGGTGSSALLTDGTSSKGLRVSINACSVAWNPANGACTGTATSILAATPVSGLANAVNIGAGAIAAGGAQYLQVSTQLPDQSETTINGTLPSGTIQGQTATLTYTFGETQRNATTTTS